MRIQGTCRELEIERNECRKRIDALRKEIYALNVQIRLNENTVDAITDELLTRADENPGGE